MQRTAHSVRQVVLTVALAELRRFFRQSRNLSVLPLSFLAVYFSLWPHVGSIFAPVCLAVFIALEPQYDNILFRTRREFEGLALFPADWAAIIRGKNLASVALTFIIFVPVSTMVVFFAPTVPTVREGLLALLYLASVSSPMLALGNLRSVQAPRRTVGWSLTDLAEAVIMLVMLVLLSVPFLVCVIILRNPLVCLLYTLGSALLLTRWSARATAREIVRRFEPLSEAP